MAEYTPTTEEVRDNWAAGIVEQTGNWPDAAWFDRWLAERDREVAATALEDLMRDSLGAIMGEVLRQRAAEIRNPQPVSTPKDADT